MEPHCAVQALHNNMEFLQQIKKTIVQEYLIQEGDRILLGISGGLDSSTLLFVLREIQKKISFYLGLAHINHSLRGKESERDEEFVKDLARSFPSKPILIKLM